MTAQPANKKKKLKKAITGTSDYQDVYVKWLKEIQLLIDSSNQFRAGICSFISHMMNSIKIFSYISNRHNYLDDTSSVPMANFPTDQCMQEISDQSVTILRKIQREMNDFDINIIPNLSSLHKVLLKIIKQFPLRKKRLPLKEHTTFDEEYQSLDLLINEFIHTWFKKFCFSSIRIAYLLHLLSNYIEHFHLKLYN